MVFLGLLSNCDIQWMKLTNTNNEKKGRGFFILAPKPSALKNIFTNMLNNNFQFCIFFCKTFIRLPQSTHRWVTNYNVTLFFFYYSNCTLDFKCWQKDLTISKPLWCLSYHHIIIIYFLVAIQYYASHRIIAVLWPG